MTTFHIDTNGKLLRSTSNPEAIIPGAVTKTDIPPGNGRAIWNGTSWDEQPPEPRDPRVQDTPGSINSIPGLRNELNALKAFLRRD